jgi:short-subunit dehydrogenase
MMKNVLILGATSDMAQAIAKKFSAEGWSLTLAALEPDLLEPIAGDLRVRAETEIKTLEFDATDFSSHRGFYESLESRPDAVICVFGYMGDQISARTDFNEVQKTIEINYTGAVSILSVVAEDFEKRGSGSIAGVSSVAGDRGRQSNYIYGSAKAGCDDRQTRVLPHEDDRKYGAARRTHGHSRTGGQCGFSRIGKEAQHGLHPLDVAVDHAGDPAHSRIHL